MAQRGFARSGLERRGRLTPLHRPARVAARDRYAEALVKETSAGGR